MVYIIESEENEKELNKLKFECNELKNEVEGMEEEYTQAIEQLNNNKNIVDIDYLKEFLEDHNIFNDELKKYFDIFLKTQVKDDIENYTFIF